MKKSTGNRMRINKYLALKGFSSRRGADELIKSQKVKINGHIAHIGELVTEADTVEVTGKEALSTYTYLAYYKPIGVVSNSPTKDEIDVITSAKIDPSLNIQPIGRLDKDSSGLLILTNDTRIIEPMLSPKQKHEKEYLVTVNEVFKRDFEEKMARGVKLRKYTTKPSKVIVHGKNKFSIVLTEGKNRQIRRMCASLGYSVKSLKRVRIMNISLGKVKPNQYRKISGGELVKFLSSLTLR